MKATGIQRLCGLCFLLAGCVSGAAEEKKDNLKSTAQDRSATLRESDVLSAREGQFYLDGQPFAEISFNKFDLLWQLYDQRVAGRTLDDANPLVQAQDKALRELHEMGFQSIRFFGLPWGPAGAESYADPKKRELLYEALDKALALCDKHQIRVVWCLASAGFTDTKWVPEKGLVHGEEQARELMSKPETRGRQLLYRYIDETVTRYKQRKTVLMWEIGNEITLLADIGCKDLIFDGERMPTLKDVAGFFQDVTRRIKVADPLRLVSSGGSHLRESQWNLYQRRGWGKDTFDEQVKCFELLYATTGVDVIDVHSYMNNKQGYVISDGAGGETLLGNKEWMRIAQRLGKPLMIGELGLHATPKGESKIWTESPNYFESYKDTAAARPWVEKALNSVVEAGVPLSYWWCYQSDRPMDQSDPQRFDLTRERNPELLNCIIEANQRLTAKLTPIVARHAITLNAPAGGPTRFMPTGPLLGNGDVGVMQSEAAEQLTYTIGKNDFWSIKHQSPIAVGQLRLLIPALKGAKFQTVSDLRLAELRGTYVNGDAAMTSRAWVDANQNFLCVELSNTGSKPLVISPVVFMGASTALPASIPANNSPVKIGCEQVGGGRWFFNGEMADMQILDHALGQEDIAVLAKQERKAVQPFDGKAGKPFSAPAISKALTVTGWIKAASLSTEADYIISKGEWSRAYSLGLSNGRLRFAIGEIFVQGDTQIPLNQWLHVAGVYDGKQIAVMVDGKVVKSSGGAAPVAGGAFFYDPDAPNAEGRKVGLATRIIGADNPAEFNLAPGASVVVAEAILSDLDTQKKNPLEAAQALVASLTTERLAANTAAHRRWWSDFWSRSFIEIPDKTIEQCWYASWYVMGSCSRAGKVAPGLWGNWLTVDNPAWHGDFHLNYNFQAPFYGLYSANHAETTLPYYDALNQSIPRGKKIAADKGWKGIHLPVSIGPWGMCPEGDNCDHGQRSNAAYCALLYIWHWQHTQDKEWLKSTGYEYLRETAAFWEDYLKFEDGRYVIHNDSIHEGSGPDMNGLLSLGLVKTLFRNMVPISEAFGTDVDKREKWRDIAEKISAFPLEEKDGKTVFRYSEKGTAWWNDNTLGIQHIFPAGAIGLDSDPKLLEISRNMIDAMGRWRDFNGSSSWYAACARVGYEPKKILAELNNMYAHHTLPNKLLNFGGGGIENVSPALGVTEMLLQSHEGVIRLFPCWPRELDARFGTLRAVGAFLVSAELKGGVISGVKITSEKGGDCTLVNPWPEKSVRVTRNGKSAETATGPRFTLKTVAGEDLALKPE